MAILAIRPFQSPPSHLFQFILAISFLVLLVRSQDDSCYINDSGFTCCNKQLGNSLMKEFIFECGQFTESAMKSAMTGKDLLSSADHVINSD